MGINIGAFLAPVTAEIVKTYFGFHPAFAVAAGGMVISVTILWWFKRDVEAPTPVAAPPTIDDTVHAAAVTEDVAPGESRPNNPMDAIPDWKRIGALLVIFLIVIVFWMVFHQNGTTLTYWANDNTDWKVSGVIAHAINPFWVVTLTFPLIFFWRWLAGKGLEPSTPTKMAIGMFMTSVAFLVLYVAARVGEAGATDSELYMFKVSPAWLIGAYALLTLGELMLSPMGLALVAKERRRGTSA